MKYLLLPIILFLSSCASVTNTPQDIELTGRLMGSYVSTSSGMSKGHILLISDSSSIQKVSAIGKGNPRKVLLVQGNPKSLDKLAGQEIKVAGKIHTEHVDIFHTDFVLSINNISRQ